MLHTTSPSPSPEPEHDSGSSGQSARTVGNTGTPRTLRNGVASSLLSVAGVALAALAARWTFTNPTLGFRYGLVAVAGILIVLIGSLVLAIAGLVAAVSWRRAGGRGWLNGLSIVLASLAIVAIAVAFALAAYAVYAILRVVSEI